MFKTLDDLEVAGKRVLVRADLNVPVHNGKVSDVTRIAVVLQIKRKAAAAAKNESARGL